MSSETTLVVSYSCLACLQIASPTTLTPLPISPKMPLLCFSHQRRSKKEEKERLLEKRNSKYDCPFRKPETVEPKHEPMRHAPAPKKGILKSSKPNFKPMEQPAPIVSKSEARRRERQRTRQVMQPDLFATPPPVQQLRHTSPPQPPVMNEHRRKVSQPMQSEMEEKTLLEDMMSGRYRGYRIETLKEHSNPFLREMLPEAVAERDEDEMNGARDKGKNESPMARKSISSGQSETQTRTPSPSPSRPPRLATSRYARTKSRLQNGADLNSKTNSDSIFSKPWSVEADGSTSPPLEQEKMML